MDSPEAYLRVSQVAEKFNISPPTVRKLIKGGELPANRIGHQYRIKQSDADAYLERTKK